MIAASTHTQLVATATARTGLTAGQIASTGGQWAAVAVANGMAFKEFKRLPASERFRLGHLHSGYGEPTEAQMARFRIMDIPAGPARVAALKAADAAAKS